MTGFSKDTWELVDRPDFLGFDDLFEKISGGTIKPPSYPPYNVRKFLDDTWLIEVAAAGFAVEELSVATEQNKLKIVGSKNEVESNDGWIHRGLAKRDFLLSFSLGEFVEVSSVDLENGVLKISLARLVPDEKKPKKIEIGFKKAVLPNLESKPELITE